MKLFLKLCCAVFALFLPYSVSFADVLSIEPNSVEAQAWIIVDPETKQVIAQHQSDAQRAPASLTKMLVAYIALKEIAAGRLDRHEILTATPVVNQVMSDESQMYLKVGEQISVDQLLAGLIVMSANDAAVTLAERISGSVPAFVQRMNQEAQALKMHNSHFQNPAGVTMPEHYSTAEDLAKLAQAIVTQTPQYLTYSKLTSFSYKDHYHKATNLLLQKDPSVDGLKTGFTRAAGYNLALTANRTLENGQQRRLIVIVMGTNSALKRAEVAHNLLNLAYVYTQHETLFQAKQLLAQIPVLKSNVKFFSVTAKQPIVVTTSLYNQKKAINLKDFDSAQQCLFVLQNEQKIWIEPATKTDILFNIHLLEKSFTAPIHQTEKVATIDVYQHQQLISRIDVEQNIELREANFFEKIWLWFQAWMSQFSTAK